jgi:hypothetical protein
VGNVTLKSWGRLIRLLLLLLVHCPGAQAVDVYFLYRPMLRSSQIMRFVQEKKEHAGWPEIWAILRRYPGPNLSDISESDRSLIGDLVQLDIRSWGHVALELPAGARPGGTVFGWEPDRQVIREMGSAANSLLADWMTAARARTEAPKTIKGRFEVGAEWMQDPSFPPPAAVREVKVSLTEFQLSMLVKKMSEMDADPFARYQPGNWNQTFSANAFNCATAAAHVLKSVGNPLDSVPADGSMMMLHGALLETSTLRDLRCGAVLKLAEAP